MVGSGRYRQGPVLWQVSLVEESDTSQIILQMHKYNCEKKAQIPDLEWKKLVR